VQAQPATWPVQSGPLPPLDEFYHPRPESGLGQDGALTPGTVTVLVPGDGGAALSPPGLGGTGKTQLAAGTVSAALQSGAADLAVWINAVSRAAIVTGYAQAAADVGAAVPGGDPEEAAQRFRAWLASTGRPWLLVLDDLTELAGLDQLWPAGPAGQVIVTTLNADPALLGVHREAVKVGGFSRREALTFLSGRLSYPDQRIGALDLAEDLGFHPLGLALAAALMADSGMGCREYRDAYAQRRLHLANAAGAGPIPPVTVCWTLAVDRANQLSPSGLAWPALVLLSLLDPGGVPGSVLTSPAACEYLTGQRTAAADGTSALVRSAVTNLARLSLVSLDSGSAIRTVRVHPVVQSAVRGYLSAAEYEQAALAAAAAVSEAWPARDTPPLLSQALRDSVSRLSHITGDLLWATGNHAVLVRAGRSLGDDGLHGAAIGYWQDMIATGGRVLGPGHALTLLARENLAAAYVGAGRAGDAISLYQQALGEQEQAVGAAHPDTLAIRSSLAHAYHTAGRLAEAIPLYEQTITEQDRVLGPVHPDTVATRRNLAAAFETAGRIKPAIAIQERILADCERTLGPGHADTLAARADLAASYHAAGQVKDAVAQYRRVLSDRERVQGPDHPDTLAARSKLASAYRAAGRIKDALPEYQRVAADRERVQGPDHPDTLTARGNLASAYHTAGRIKDAIPLYERYAADRERVQGPDHPDTLTARGNLASAYHTAGRMTDAIPLYESVLADCERVLGHHHPDTLTSRANLAHAYHTARRMTEAVALFERTLADCEESLGPRHPMTETVRESLEAVRG
jgi:tetratricopeptide (TPR) repeat protein